MKLIEKLTNTLQNDLTIIRMFVLLFVLNLVVVLPLSVKATNTFNKRNELKNKLIEIKMDMETKLGQLRQSSVVYSEALSYKNDLDSALPSDSDIQNYLVSLVETASGVGYVLTDLNINYRQVAGEVYINLKMEGAPSNIGNVIDALESMPRITEVQDITVNFNNPDDILIVVKVFVVEAGS